VTFPRKASSTSCGSVRKRDTLQVVSDEINSLTYAPDLAAGTHCCSARCPSGHLSPHQQRRRKLVRLRAEVFASRENTAVLPVPRPISRARPRARPRRFSSIRSCRPCAPGRLPSPSSWALRPHRVISFRPRRARHASPYHGALGAGRPRGHPGPRRYVPTGPSGYVNEGLDLPE